MDVKTFLADLAGQMSVVGFEYYDEEKLTALVGPYFDEHEYDKVGNHIFIKRCGKANAKRLFIDTHYDEVGLMVKNITDDGHLRVCGQGGVDARIFPGAEVVVYGKKKLPGIVLTMARQQMTNDEKNKLVAVTNLLVDTGLTKEEAEAITPIGTPVGYEPVYTELLNGYMAGKGFDNKCSAVPVIDAISKLDMSKLDCDIYFNMSAREEVGHKAVTAAANRIRPDYAIVLDVTFGMAPEGKKTSDMDMKKGPTLSISAILDKDFTDFCMDTAKKNDIPYQLCVDATSTGTHADDVIYAAGGIPTVLVSIPLWFMHTANEVINLEDIDHTSDLLVKVITEKFGRKDG